MDETFKDLVELIEERGLGHLDEAQRTLIATLGLRYLVRLGDEVSALPEAVKVQIDAAIAEQFEARDRADERRLRRMQTRYTFWGTVVASVLALVSAVVVALLA